jgi:hypothetical protein
MVKMMPNTTGETETAEQLLNTLLTMRAAAIYDIFGQICLHEFFKQAHRGEADLATLKTTLPEGEVTLKQFVTQIDSDGPHALVETKRNANKFVTRNLLKEAFRLTAAYCDSTNQRVALKSQAWYQFARVLVNCLSHNFRLEFRAYDKQVLPVSFREHTITEGMDGGPARFQLQVLLDLTEEIIGFARTMV